MLVDRDQRGRAKGTLDMYRVKAGHVIRLLGAATSLARVDARAVDAFIEMRLAEGAARSTIQKDLVTIRAMLKVAKRRGEFRGEVAGVMPDGFEAGYRPRSRFLAETEASRLLGELTADRAARVAFILATGARWGETDRVQRADVDRVRGVVFLRGTKTEGAPRVVPIVGWGHPLLARRTLRRGGERGTVPRLAERSTRPRGRLQAGEDRSRVAERPAPHVRHVAPPRRRRARAHRRGHGARGLANGRTRVRAHACGVAAECAPEASRRL